MKIRVIRTIPEKQWLSECSLIELGYNKNDTENHGKDVMPLEQYT